jgi:hypothetical protein
MSAFRISEAFADPTCDEYEDSLLDIQDAPDDVEIASPIGLPTELIGPKLDAMAAGVIAPHLDALSKMAAGLIGPKLDAMAAGLIAPHLDAMDKMAAGLIGPKLDAMAAGVIGSQVDALNEMAAGLIAPHLDAMDKMAAALIGPQLYPLGGLIDLDQLVKSFSAVARVDRALAGPEREQLRQLWGQYVYVQVWLICLLLLLVVTINGDKASNVLLTVSTGATGICGHSAASKARKLALDNFDRVFPPGSKIPTATKILL